MDRRDDQGMAYHFRFRRLDEATATTLAKTLEHLDPDVHLRFDKLSYVLLFQLEDDIDELALLETMRQHGVKSHDVDIFASLVAEWDSDIIDVPEHVTRVLRVTCARLTFSFTYVGEPVNQ
jgi:hypothetical protein